MKRLGFLSLGLMAVAMVLLTFSSCSEDDPPPVPTVRILADVDETDGYMVNITVEATDVDTYSWDYGDGGNSTTAGNHSYTYEASGDYKITVSVTGEGGTASAFADVVIEPSVEEMLSGVDAAGKTWVLTQTPANSDGAGPLSPDEFGAPTLPFALVGDALAYVELPDEYDNSFTFMPDGSFSVDNGNGVNLCTQIFAGALIQADPSLAAGYTEGRYGFATMPWVVDGATWEVEEYASIEFDAASEDPASSESDPPLTDMTVSISDLMKINIVNGYFGILDAPNIPQLAAAYGLEQYIIVEDISPSELHIVLVMHTRLPEKPSMFARLTFIPEE